MKISNSSERIQKLLDMYGLSQADFGRKCGLSRSIVSLYVSGKREPAQDNIFKIAQAFNVDPAWVMGYEIEMRPNVTADIEEHFSLKTADLMNRISAEERVRKYMEAYLSLPEDKRKLVEDITYSYLPDNDNESK